MRVAAQILQDVLRSAEGSLGINHPFALAKRRYVTGESLRVAQRLQIPEELEFSGGVRFLQRVQKHTPKKTAEDLDRQQEAAAALDPAVVIHRQAAAGNHAVQVRVEVKILPPGVEHGEEAEFHTQTRGVAGDGEQSLRGGAKQDI